MSRYLVVIELVGVTGGSSNERERAAFEAALQRAYPEQNRAGYSTLLVTHFEKLEDLSANDVRRRHEAANKVMDVARRVRELKQYLEQREVDALGDELLLIAARLVGPEVPTTEGK